MKDIKMNIEEFDQKMKSKMDKMGKFSKNLSELILQKEYMIVQSSLKKKDGFVGDTSNLAEKLVDSIQELTIGSTLLGDALNRASQFRDKSNVMNFGIKIRNEASFQEAVKILEGKSVKMALREVSIMRRGAFDDAEEEVFLTPDETLKLLGDAFRETQTYLLKITNAIQDAYNGIEKAEMLMKDLQPKIQENDTRLEKIDQILKVWKGKVNQDPIGVINALENEIFTPLKQEDLRIKEELQKKEDCEQKINEADENIKNLEELDRQVSEKIFVLKTKISDWTYKPLDMENARELFVWFDGLKKTFERGKYDSCLVGFSKWNLLYGQVFQERFESPCKFN